MPATIETVGAMTVEEFRALVEEIVREQLSALVGDPDEGLELRRDFRERLIAQRKRVRKGERGAPLDEVVARLDL